MKLYQLTQNQFHICLIVLLAKGLSPLINPIQLDLQVEKGLSEASWAKTLYAYASVYCVYFGPTLKGLTPLYNPTASGIVKKIDFIL